MGPKQSQVEQTTIQQTINHQKFKNAKFKKDQNQYIQITVPVVNERQYATWAQNLKKIPSQRLQSVMLPIWHKFSQEGLCGSSGLVNIDYDNFPFLLHDQIINRQYLDHKQFQQNQLWYLLYTLIFTARDFHLKKQKVGDIRPQNIFINQDGQIRIATHYSWPGQSFNYDKTFYQKQITYLSPQEIKDIQFGKTQSSVSPDQSQAFSIGLTCLDAALLSDSKGLYSKTGKFQYQLLQEKLNKLKNSKYSQLFYLIISNLCATQSSHRSTCKDIYQWMLPYQQPINNLEDFHVTTLPEKIAVSTDKHQGPSIPVNRMSGVTPQRVIIENRPQQPPIQRVIIDNRSSQVPVPIVQQLPQRQVTMQPPSNVPVVSVSHYIQHPSQVHPQETQGQRLQYIPVDRARFIPPHQQQQTTIVGPNRVVYQQQGSNVYPRPQNNNSNSKVVFPNQQLIGSSTNNMQVYEQSVTQKQVTQTKISNGQNITSEIPSKDEYSKTLQKIDQQLKLSRKMFPS